MKVCCLGGSVVDYIYTVDRLPVGDGKHLAKHRKEAPGGLAASAAVAIARLGGEVAFYGRLGDDLAAKLILESFRQEGIDVTHLRRYPRHVSPHSIVLVDDSGDRTIILYGADNLPSDPSWLPLLDFANADAVLADVRWPEGAIVALKQARAAGKPAVLDAEISSDPRAFEALENASHVVFSAQGLQALAKTTSVEDGLKWVWEHTRSWVGVTVGDKGVLWTQSGRVEAEPAISVDAVETLGAGDVFHGAFTLALAEGQSPTQAVRFASAVAALKCSRRGGRASYPNRNETQLFIKQHSL
jgi:sulfofructose kinase